MFINTTQTFAVFTGVSVHRRLAIPVASTHPSIDGRAPAGSTGPENRTYNADSYEQLRAGVGSLGSSLKSVYAAYLRPGVVLMYNLTETL